MTNLVLKAGLVLGGAAVGALAGYAVEFKKDCKKWKEFIEESKRVAKEQRDDFESLSERMKDNLDEQNIGTLLNSIEDESMRAKAMTYISNCIYDYFYYAGKCDHENKCGEISSALDEAHQAYYDLNVLIGLIKNKEWQLVEINLA